MFSLPAENWYRLIVWLLIGFVIYFSYGYKHSELRKQHEHEQMVGARSTSRA